MSFFRQKTSNDLVPMRQRGILFDVMSWQPGWTRTDLFAAGDLLIVFDKGRVDDDPLGPTLKFDTGKSGSS